MKALLIVITCCGAAIARAEAPAATAVPASSNGTEKVLAVRAAQETAVAGKQGLSLEEYRKRRAEESRALREKNDSERAARQGVSLEEYRAQRKAKHEERTAKRLGVSVEELRKMTPDEKKARLRELRAKRQAELKAKQEKKETK